MYVCMHVYVAMARSAVCHRSMPQVCHMDVPQGAPQGCVTGVCHYDSTAQPRTTRVCLRGVSQVCHMDVRLGCVTGVCHTTRHRLQPSRARSMHTAPGLRCNVSPAVPHMRNLGHRSYIHTYIHTYQHTCTHAYIHVHTHTHTYMHTGSLRFGLRWWRRGHRDADGYSCCTS